ncbi:hypothetical protein [Aquibium oceanicum]|uniref:Uncharacterized protein n=1 Tax=Aquibium oceanicum TaxID=1670800 RepID=A0A1L3SUA1_9HYPH|nr:hypothetical protein [Aquibium oceanicum]APH72979.1 hypothetical protein BSQ44_17605 [Aquibium oceanicum]
MALRAIISQESPDIAGDWEELWYGGVGASDDEEASGVTTAAILSFIPEAQPGVWYKLADFAALLASLDWTKEAEGWTSLNLTEQAVAASPMFTTDIPLSEAVASVCLNALDLLKSLDKKHVWVRIE